MHPDNIDDLFRQRLGSHATPPGDDLQSRLDTLAAAEHLDAQFRAGLAGHATPPRRELWERLEDEHLHPQPRRRRVAAWWQYSAAAVLLLCLLAGGARLWHGRQAGSGLATTAPGDQGADALASPRHRTPLTHIDAGHEQPATNVSTQQTNPQLLAANTVAGNKKSQQISSAQATAASLSPSSPPIASTSQPRRPATVHRLARQLPTQGQQPDAGASLLAGLGGQNTPAGQPTGRSQAAGAATVAPAATLPAPAALALAAAPTATPEIIEVEVRRGPAASLAAPAQPAVVAAAPTPAHRPRLRLGGLLRQADHLVHGEPVSLAEATGLPETVTLQAHVGGRTLSRTIQL